MKNKKKMDSNICSRCGGKIDPSSSLCPVCGEAISVQGIATTDERKSRGVLRGLFSALFGLLLTAATVLLELLLFLYALNENVRLPSLGSISGDWLSVFFDSWYSLALGGALVLIPMLSLVLINTHRIRRIFITVGISSMATAIFSIVLGLTGAQIVKAFSGEWQDILIYATVAFEDFAVLCAVILIIIGAACISIYSSIAVVKGAKHEKDI